MKARMQASARERSSGDILESWFVLRDSLHLVEERIARACERAGRRREQITLLAVTKVFPAGVILDAYELGIRHFGENYVQEFAGKAPVVAHLSEATFHLLGHLQSNKAAKAAELFGVIQTVDSVKLARRLDESGKRLDVMLEVKLSPEETKTRGNAGRCAGSGAGCSRVSQPAAARPHDDAAVVR
jgi:pyridoxal phosphate enzyme (YggS family)